MKAKKKHLGLREFLRVREWAWVVYITLFLSAPHHSTMDSAIEIVEVTDESVKMLRWKGPLSYVLLTFLSACGFLSASIKLLFIKYLVWHAPKNRPINNLLLVDQVSFTFVSAETLLRLCWDSTETLLRLHWDSTEIALRLYIRFHLGSTISR